MYTVNNLLADWRNYKYTVIRDCRDTNEGWWYYTSCNSLELAQEACNEINNGWIVETSQIQDAYVDSLGYNGNL
jgi:hypothetical protein